MSALSALPWGYGVPYEEPELQAALSKLRTLDPQSEAVVSQALSMQHTSILAYEAKDPQAVVIRSVSRIAQAMQESTRANVELQNDTRGLMQEAVGAMHQTGKVMADTSARLQVLLDDFVAERAVARQMRTANAKLRDRVVIAATAAVSSLLTAAGASLVTAWGAPAVSPPPTPPPVVAPAPAPFVGPTP